MGNSIKSCKSCLNLEYQTDITVDGCNIRDIKNKIDNNPILYKLLVKLQAKVRGIFVRSIYKGVFTKKNEKRLMPFLSNNLKFKLVSTTNSISDDRFNKLCSTLEKLNDHVKVIVQVVEYDNFSVYYGEWNQYSSHKHGRGINVWNFGSIYEGYWKNNKANGFGTLTHSDGDKYEGNWIDNQACGYGVYTYSDGSYYKGEWLNNKQH